MGADGLVNAGFECAGGNHIFRYEPTLVNGEWAEAKGKKTAGGKYHDFFKSRAEHKTYLCKYDPATGEYLRGVAFCTRTSKGDANAVRMKEGAVAGFADGSIISVGQANASLPVTLMPEDSGDYKGGGYALVMGDDWKKMELCTRIQSGASPHAVDTREINGKTHIAIAGTSGKEGEPFGATNPLNEKEEAANCGFLAVIGK